MATTTNFGWETPDDTDLVKDGAAAIRTLGQSIDTSMADLEGGTTGQVLSKASNADMDFTWTNADPLVILDAKGDLISATAADTPARLAVGTNGQVLTADSTTSTGLKWAAASGGMTLLSTTTLSGVTTTVSSIDQTYTNLFCIVSGFTSASFAPVSIRYNGVTSGYYGVAMGDSTTANTRQTNTGSIDTAVGGSPKGSDTSGLLTFTIANYAATGFHHVPWDTVYMDNDASIIRVVSGIAANSNTSAVSSISLGLGVSLTGGTIKIYGVK
jgi:hypothetical protein